MFTEICYAVSFIIESLISLFYFNSKFEKRAKTPIILLALGIHAGVSFALIHMMSPIINASIFIAGNFIILLTCYESRLVSCIFNTLIIFAMMFVSELIVEYSLVLMYEYQIYNAYENAIGEFVQSFFSRAIYFVSVFLLSKILIKEEYGENVKHSAMLCILPLGTAIYMYITMYITYYMVSAIEIEDWLKITLIITNVIILISNIVVFYVHEQTLKSNRVYTELQLLKQKEKDAKNYYELLTQQNENSRIIMHDIKRHLNSIKELSIQGNKNIADYIDGILGDFQINETVNYCNNALVNAIANRYKSICKTEEISFNIDIRTTQIDFMDEHDITALLDNLLENAVEAAKTVDNGFIDFSITKRNHNFLAISVLNSTNSKPYINKGIIKSTKSNTALHGIGLRSIKRVIKKYNGKNQLFYNEDDKTFSNTIIFKI